jgi:hypothetical protein
MNFSSRRPVTLECIFDTSTQSVEWGERATDEMCLGGFHWAPAD